MRDRLELGVAAPLAIFCAAASLVARVAVGIDQPLWLDEVWTGAIAAQTDFAHLLQQIYLDVNAPLYYVFIYVWAKLFGLSNEALRFPSVVFGFGAALLAATSRLPNLSTEARWTWVAMLALWFPGIWHSQDARCYALLLFICTAQTIVFVRLLATPTLRFACCWAAISSLALLTHYNAIYITACEAAAYLALRRGACLRTWPAAFVFAPALGWITYHFPRIVQFADPAVAWYNPIRLADLGPILVFLFGAIPFWLGSAALIVLWRRIRRQPEPDAAKPSIGPELWSCMVAGCAATALIIAIGFLRPTFISRYLIPNVPSVMLGVAIVGQAIVPYWKHCYSALMIFCLCSSVLSTIQFAGRARAYSFEEAAQNLMTLGVTRLVFTWDHPASPVFDRSQLSAMGRFLFERAQHPITIIPAVLYGAENPSANLLKVAKADRAAILWLYDTAVHDTAARFAPPEIDRLDRTWRCHNYGEATFGALACHPIEPQSR